jgi:hypothetical protein
VELLICFIITKVPLFSDVLWTNNVECSASHLAESQEYAWVARLQSLNHFKGKFIFAQTVPLEGAVLAVNIETPSDGGLRCSFMHTVAAGLSSLGLYISK